MAVKAASEIRKGLEEIVGADAVSYDPQVLKGYESCMGPVPDGKPVAMVTPRDAAEVQAIVRLANRLDLNLVPASSGGPRFRGGTVPSGEGVILALSGMDGIVRLDARNKVAIIGPKVTFSAFKEEAEKQGMKIFMPLLPRHSKSVLASYLEREPILIPRFHWDMTDPMLCAELVFGSGDIFRTGSAAGPGSLEEQWEAGMTQKNPTGPAATDFARVAQGAQGTMGIVTWASVKLEVQPGKRRLYFIAEKSLEKLIDFSYRMLRLRLGDEFLILNGFALSSMLGENTDEIRALASKQAPYILVYCVAGYKHFPEKRVDYQEKGIADIAQHYGVSIVRSVPGTNYMRMMELLDNPSAEPYWKLRPKGGVREIFFLTTMDRMQTFMSIMEKAAGDFDFPIKELGVYIQPIQQGRACHLEFDLFFDPSDESESKKIDELFMEASRGLADAGAFFSRPYGPWAKIAYERCPDTVATLKMVKEILDPKGILNRGKLCF